MQRSGAGDGPRDASHLVLLDADHPGFRDAGYRQRRDLIASSSTFERTAEVLERLASVEEHIWSEFPPLLQPLHQRWACRELLACQARLPLPLPRIPQLAELNAVIRPATGFRMAPVAGLVGARHFLEHLGQGIFLATQYIRHHSRPLYTPEPDVVHELIGHAASFLDPGYARLSRAFGQAAARADDATLTALERIYWYTVEFGVVREEGKLKACGAGLISGAFELEHFASQARLLPFDLEAMAQRPYDPTGYQEVLFVAERFSDILELADRFERTS